MRLYVAFDMDARRAADSGPRPAAAHYLYFASPKAVAQKIITDIFRNYEAKA
jgi:hypothetical protein